MISFNHAKYIHSSISSVLRQERSFPIEIVISDDCSTDGTGEIIDQFERENPSIINRIDPSENIGMIANLQRVWSHCQGEFIAFLEGDDWWHDATKLETQVQFMEDHPDCVISGHGVRVIDFDDNVIRQHPRDPESIPQITGPQELLEYNFIHSSSMMCRQGTIDDIPQWFKRLHVADRPLWLLHAIKGPAGFIHKTMSTYRVHPGGVWSMVDPVIVHNRMRIAMRLLGENTPKPWSKLFHQESQQLAETVHWLSADKHRRSGKPMRGLVDYIGLFLHYLTTQQVRPMGKLFRPTVGCFLEFARLRKYPTSA